jgi:hypothetical protein
MRLQIDVTWHGLSNCGTFTSTCMATIVYWLAALIKNGKLKEIKNSINN